MLVNPIEVNIPVYLWHISFDIFSPRIHVNVPRVDILRDGVLCEVVLRESILRNSVLGDGGLRNECLGHIVLREIGVWHVVLGEAVVWHGGIPPIILWHIIPGVVLGKSLRDIVLREVILGNSVLDRLLV